jgi:hypothetical protein
MQNNIALLATQGLGLIYAIKSAGLQSAKLLNKVKR